VGDKHLDAKPLKGFACAGVLEIVADHDGDAFRAVYTVRFAYAIYALHYFKRNRQGVSPHRNGRSNGFGNGADKLRRIMTEQERQLWGECARLLTNCMLYDNATLSSQLGERKTHSGDAQGVALPSQVSPVAWQHIDVYGCYELSRGPTAINMHEIIKELDRVPMAPELV
jgi:hypothetical protein